MQTLTNSAFLQALGYAIAHSLWQMAIIWAICTAVNNFLQLPARSKYTVAVIAQLLGFVWFAFTLQYYYFQCTEAIRSTGLLVGTNGINFILPHTNNSFNAYLLSFFLQTERLLPYLSIAYLVVFISLSIKWMYCYHNAQTLRTEGLQKIDVDWKLFVKQTAAYLGIKKEVRIFLSEQVTTPLTIGFLKPVILVPLASLNHLSTEQMEAVLLHELAHIKRMDYLLNIALSIIETILFFNPFTQLISTAIKKEREHSCDDWVLQFQYNATTYASALLQIAVLQNSPAIAMTAVGKKNDLLSRVRRIVDKQNNRFNYRNQLISLLFITIVLFSVTWIVPQQKNVITNSNSIKLKSTSLMIEPMAAKVSNPLFNPLFFFRKPLQEEIRKNIAQAEIEIAEASKQMEQMPTQVAAVMPVAIQALQSLQLEEDTKQTIESNAAEDKRLAQFIADTVKQNFVFNEKQFAQGWQLLGEEMKKVGTELEKKQFSSSLQNKQSVWLNEVNKTINQFKQMQDAFKLKGNNLELEVSNAFKEALSSKNISKTVAVAKAEIAKNKRYIDSARMMESKRKRYLTKVEEAITENNYYKLATTIPGFQYALNNTSNATAPVITTSSINNEVVTFISIKAKHSDSLKTNITPKRYEVVVSNTGKPDKKIIIEVL